MDDCIDNIGQAKYVTKFDLLKGFWQIPLTDRANEISASVIPAGLFFPRDVLDEILNLIESVSEDFPSYSLSTQS